MEKSSTQNKKRKGRTMKKFLAMSLALMMSLSLAACGSSTPSSSAGTSGSSGSASAAQPRILRLSTHLSADHGCVKMAQKFNELLQSKTNGALSVDIYTDGQLGGQTENCEGLKSGSVDMTIVDTGTLANYEPKIGILDMPYVFASKDQAIAVASGEVGQGLMDTVTTSTGIRPVSLQAVLFRNTLLKDKEVTTPADFKGVKIRIPENPSIEACFTALGATPVAIPSGEAYTAVQTGVTNGLEGNLEFIAQQKYYEVANVCSLTEHVMTFTAMCISESVYESLTPDQQTAFNEAAAEAMDYFYPLYETIESDSRKVMEDAGVEFHDVDKEAMIAACTPTLKAFVEKNDLQSVYDAINALK